MIQRARMTWAIRYGAQPEVRARLMQVVENVFDRSRLQVRIPVNLTSDSVRT